MMNQNSNDTKEPPMIHSSPQYPSIPSPNTPPLSSTTTEKEEENFIEDEINESVEVSLHETEILPTSSLSVENGTEAKIMEGSNDDHGNENENGGTLHDGDHNNNHEVRAMTTVTTNTTTEEEEKELSLQELMYAANSYHAIAKPVSITMILSALAVLQINTDETRSAAQKQMSSTYTVFTISDTQGAATNLANSLGNTLIIVAVICFMTFVIVILYKFRCMKLLLGYMILSSTILFFLLGGLMFQVAINKYSLPIDYLSYIFTMYNFSFVGTIAVFYQRGGVPTFVTHLYLIATSVILAWQLSNFDDWTAWTLLVMLALYDLCAVLTPCGPLKALVNLMSREDAPEMPGLLYEAEVTRNGRNNTPTSVSSSQLTQQHGQEQNHSLQLQQRQSQQSQIFTYYQQQHRDDENNEYETSENNVATEQSTNRDPLPSPHISLQPIQTPSQTMINGNDNTPSQNRPPPPSSPVATNHDQNSSDTQKTAMLPLAIAKIYKLPILSPPDFATVTNHDSNGNSTTTPNEILARQYTPQQLLSNVEVCFPRRGGWIEVRHLSSPPQPTVNDDDHHENTRIGFPSKWRRKRQRRQSERRDGVAHTYNSTTRYIVMDRRGEVKRVLLLDDMGKVYEELEGETHDNDHNHSDVDNDEGVEEQGGEDRKRERNSIRLGLGDFIFYSVLVSKAAQNSFTTFASCMLVVLAGLGGTLVLLSVYQHALPALPISIFLGVVFYLLTKALMEPWIKEVLTMPYYV